MDKSELHRGAKLIGSVRTETPIGLGLKHSQLSRASARARGSHAGYGWKRTRHSNLVFATFNTLKLLAPHKAKSTTARTQSASGEPRELDCLRHLTSYPKP